MIFNGYKRKDNSIGVRNNLLVMSTVMCSNEVTDYICRKVDGAVPIIHGHGCCQVPSDLMLVENTLTALIHNPNTAGVLLVSLGCEGVKYDTLENAAIEAGKPFAKIQIQKTGSVKKAREEGVKLAKQLLNEIENTTIRAEGTMNDIVVGIKCGASDTLSGIITNPIVGRTVDKILDAGGRVIFGEVTEFIGAENYLSKRITDPIVKDQVFNAIDGMEQRVKATGEDMRKGQPTPGNIRGGLTSIEEKSLGAVVKSGTHIIDGFIDYGQRIKSAKLNVLDSPGREPELLTGLAAAGAQIIIFTTGIGAPQGHPVSPVIKITGNSRTASVLQDVIDVGLNEELTADNAEELLEKLSENLLHKIEEVSNGGLTLAEENEYNRFINIYVKGPII